MYLINNNLARKSLYPQTIDLKMTDTEGLQRAYATKNGVYTFGNRMLIAGARDLNDAADDFSRIPYYGDSRNIQPYQDARDELMKHPEVNQITGHSLGASTALQIQKDYKHIQGTRTYGASVLNITPHIGPPERRVDRYRSYGDPISSLDFKDNSTSDFSNLNPFNIHDYDELG